MVADQLEKYGLEYPLESDDITAFQSLLQLESDWPYKLSAFNLSLQRSAQGETFLVTRELNQNNVSMAWPGLLEAMQEQTTQWHSQGQYAKAKGLSSIGLRLALSALGCDDPITLTSLSDLAACHNSMGQAQQGKALYEIALIFGHKILGEQHPEYLKILNGLAFCLDNLGESPQALPLYGQILEMRQAVLGKEHPDTLASLNNLAFCLHNLNRLSEALPYYRLALTLRRQTLGDGHDTLVSLSNLALCLSDLGKHEDALPLLEDAERLGCKILGERHPDYLTVLNNLAFCLMALGSLDTALPWFEQAVTANQASLGIGHPGTLTALNNWAICLHSLGRTDDARTRLEQALEQVRNTLGEQHPDTLASLSNFGACLKAMGRTAEALEIALSLARKLIAFPRPWGTWMALFNKVVPFLVDQIKAGAYADWVSLFREMDQALRESLDLQDPRQLANSEKIVAGFYWAFLDLCMTQRRDLIPEVYSGLQGRNLAALAWEALDAKALDENPVTAQLLALRQQLRQLALSLQTTGLESEDGIDPEIKISQWKSRWKHYEAIYEKYRSLYHEILPNDPLFALSPYAQKPNMAELQAGIRSDEALVLLLHSEGDQVAFLGFIITPDQPEPLVKLLYLAEACSMVKTYSHGMAGKHDTKLRRARLTFEDEEMQDAQPIFPIDNIILLKGIEVALTEGFWKPLQQALPNVKTIHLVSHGATHLLPFELGCPATLRFSHYPGFVYYNLLSKNVSSKDKTLSQMSLGLSVHDGKDSGYTIPMVHAEAALVYKLWPGRVHPGFDFHDFVPSVDWLHLAGHGDSSPSAPSQSYLYLGPQKIIGFSELFNAPQMPKGAFIAACLLGQTREDSGGDPLGFAGILLLRGVCYVIAALQPIPDDYMPLLACLFYQSWQRQGGHPANALTEAKRRILTGDWYEDTEALIREAYVVMSDKAGHDTITLVETLCVDRANPPPKVVELCAWVRGFGRGGD